MHAPRNGKRTLQRVVKAIGNFMAGPISDETNETPTVAEVNRGKASAAGTKRRKARKKGGAKAATTKRVASTKKRAPTKKRGAAKKRSAPKRGRAAKKGRATKKRSARK